MLYLFKLHYCIFGSSSQGSDRPGQMCNLFRVMAVSMQRVLGSDE